MCPQSASPLAHRHFKGSGVRLAYGVNRDADAQGVEAAHQFVKGKSASGFESEHYENSLLNKRQLSRWGLVYEEGVEQTDSGTPVHALELAHAAKLNLGTVWGIGESSVPGPQAHHRTAMLPGMGFVAVAGPNAETTGVLKLDASDASRAVNMARAARAALDLMAHLQGKAVPDAPSPFSKGFL